jgi:hypothetical protein
MSETIDLHSDQFMTLLTDALRAGPGSPEWHQAVKVRRASDQNVDEYTLLYAARERLESGKEYRSVRPGPGFTLKVLVGIEEEGGGPSAAPATANVIALLAAGVILAVVVVIGVMLLKGGNPQQQAIEGLSNQIFGNKFLSAGFGGQPTTAPSPDGWTRFGPLPLFTKNNELHPAALPPNADPKVYKAGGIVTSGSIPADRPLEVDVPVRLSKAADDGIVQVFVSDEPIADDNAAGGHALVWQLKAGEARVFLADGRAAPQGEKFPNLRELPVKLLLNRDTAIVETVGKRLYAGPHLLDPARPRYVGVRFLRRGGETWDHLSVGTVTLQKP